ncbi:MAG: hypothetical protein IPN86_20890, partial [Saprospiraceae bacterium]|nr:hypothetical protein [Saprospiraceae bacterium]
MENDDIFELYEQVIKDDLTPLELDDVLKSLNSQEKQHLLELIDIRNAMQVESLLSKFPAINENVYSTPLISLKTISLAAAFTGFVIFTFLLSPKKENTAIADSKSKGQNKNIENIEKLNESEMDFKKDSVIILADSYKKEIVPKKSEHKAEVKKKS